MTRIWLLEPEMHTSEFTDRLNSSAQLCAVVNVMSSAEIGAERIDSSSCQLSVG